MFEHGETRKFASDYDIAQSFRDLFEEKDITPHDISLLRQERLVSLLTEKNNIIYEGVYTLAEKSIITLPNYEIFEKGIVRY